jgi:hypothetical protein
MVGRRAAYSLRDSGGVKAGAEIRDRSVVMREVEVSGPIIRINSFENHGQQLHKLVVVCQFGGGQASRTRRLQFETQVDCQIKHVIVDCLPSGVGAIRRDLTVASEDPKIGVNLGVIRRRYGIQPCINVASFIEQKRTRENALGAVGVTEKIPAIRSGNV